MGAPRALGGAPRPRPWQAQAVHRQRVDPVLTHQRHNESNCPNPDPFEFLFSTENPKRKG